MTSTWRHILACFPTLHVLHCFYLFSPALCSEDTTYSPLYGNYTWPDSISGGTTHEIQCYYANLQSTYSNCFDLGIKVQRYCNQLGFWEEPQYQQCPTLKRCQLLQVADVCFPCSESSSVDQTAVAGNVHHQIFIACLIVSRVPQSAHYVTYILTSHFTSTA